MAQWLANIEIIQRSKEASAKIPVFVFSEHQLRYEGKNYLAAKEQLQLRASALFGWRSPQPVAWYSIREVWRIDCVPEKQVDSTLHPWRIVCRQIEMDYLRAARSRLLVRMGLPELTSYSPYESGSQLILSFKSSTSLPISILKERDLFSAKEMLSRMQWFYSQLNDDLELALLLEGHTSVWTSTFHNMMIEAEIRHPELFKGEN